MAGQHTAKKGRSAKDFLAGQHKAFVCQASADLFIGPVTACWSDVQWWPRQRFFFLFWQCLIGSTCCDRPYKMVSWCSTRKCSMLTGQEAFCWPALFSYMLTGQCCVFAICWPAMLIPMIVHFYELLFFAFFLQYDDRPISVVFQSK